MRVIGPNALGVANTDPAVRLNATLAPDVPGRGRAGFFAQSGALGIAILAAAKERGLGLSTFVSAGNRADVSGNDLLQYWQTDPSTDLVLLYLETFGNPRKFGRLARRLARTKPVVAVKSGRHADPAAAIAAGVTPIDDASVKVLFEQAGVIRVETLSRAVRHRAAAVLPAAAGRGPGRRGGQLHRARRPGQRRPAGRGPRAGRRARRRRRRRLARSSSPPPCAPPSSAPRPTGDPAAAGPDPRRSPAANRRSNRARRDRTAGRRPDRGVRAPGGHPRRRLRPRLAHRGRRSGHSGGRGVPGRRGSAGRAGRARPGRRARARLHPQLSQSGAGRGRAGQGAPLRALAVPTGRRVRLPGRHRHRAGPRAGRRHRGRASHAPSATSRRWTCWPATASR